MERGDCEVCLRDDMEIVGVAAVPGAPVSLRWCKECLQRGAQPVFCVEVVVCPCDPEARLPDGSCADEDLASGVTWAKLQGANPVNHLADWFLDSPVYWEDGYLPTRDLINKLYEEAPAA